MGEQQQKTEKGVKGADAAVEMETEVTSFCVCHISFHERSLLPVFRRLHRPPQLGLTVPQGCGWD